MWSHPTVSLITSNKQFLNLGCDIKYCLFVLGSICLSSKIWGIDSAKESGIPWASPILAKKLYESLSWFPVAPRDTTELLLPKCLCIKPAVRYLFIVTRLFKQLAIFLFLTFLAWFRMYFIDNFACASFRWLFVKKSTDAKDTSTKFIPRLASNSFVDTLW